MINLNNINGINTSIIQMFPMFEAVHTKVENSVVHVTAALPKTYWVGLGFIHLYYKRQMEEFILQNGVRNTPYVVKVI